MPHYDKMEEGVRLSSFDKDYNERADAAAKVFTPGSTSTSSDNTRNGGGGGGAAGGAAAGVAVVPEGVDTTAVAFESKFVHKTMDWIEEMAERKFGGDTSTVVSFLINKVIYVRQIV